MAAEPAAPRLLVVGANHRTSGLGLRDRLHVPDAEAPLFLQGLGRIGIGQALVLSTCDRVEVVAVHADAPTAATAIATQMAGRGATVEAPEVAESGLFTLVDEAALRHLFAVAAALDSLVIGEPQVLGQVKAAHRLAAEAGLMGPELEAALSAAYTAAKRVRNETAIGDGAVSLVASAIKLARRVHGDLGRVSGLLIGAGDLGEVMAEELQRAGLRQLAVTGPSRARAEELARRLGCHSTDFAPLEDALVAADVIISAAGSGRHLIDAGMMERVLRRRRHRPVFVIDLGVPSDIDPGIEAVDGAFRYDLDDLERTAMSGRLNRAAAAAAAWEIVETELRAFWSVRAERVAVPALTALRAHFAAERQRVLAEVGGDAERATELLIQRLLHAPSEALRLIAAEAAGGGPSWQEAERLLRQLFRLSEENGRAEPPSAEGVER